MPQNLISILRNGPQNSPPEDLQQDSPQSDLEQVFTKIVPHDVEEKSQHSPPPNLKEKDKTIAQDLMLNHLLSHDTKLRLQSPTFYERRMTNLEYLGDLLYYGHLLGYDSWSAA